MKRLVFIGAAACVLGALALSATAIAGAGVAAPSHALVHNAALVGTPVTVGSEWNLYTDDFPRSGTCEIVLFQGADNQLQGTGKHSFLSDGSEDSYGNWRSSATSTKLTITSGLPFVASSYKFSWVSEGYWVGNKTISTSGQVLGPFILTQGAAPPGYGVQC